MFNLVVLIDLKKAFDTVDHQILLRELELYGMKGQALSFLNSYLSNRSQKCQINGFLSSEKVIRCGVPQGSILWPLFFLLYINDLPQCLSKTKPRLFADDTNLKNKFYVRCMDHSFGIIFLRKLKRANPFLPFGRKSLLTLIIKANICICKYIITSYTTSYILILNIFYTMFSIL
jgi:hypothetical protein